MSGLVYQSDGVEEKESQSHKSEAMNIKLDLEVASWRSIWLLVPVGKNEVSNTHILHWEREDSSTLLFCKQHPDTPAPSYLPMLPSETLFHKRSWWVCLQSLAPWPIPKSCLWDNICATESHQNYRWEKRFALSAHRGMLGGTGVCGLSPACPYLCSQIGAFICQRKGSVSWKVQGFRFAFFSFSFCFACHYLFIQARLY